MGWRGRFGVKSFDSFPDDSIEFFVGDCIGFRPVELLGLFAPFVESKVFGFYGDVVFMGYERIGVHRFRERTPHRDGGSVILAHGGYAEDEFYGSDH